MRSILRSLTKGQVKKGRSNKSVVPVIILVALFLLGQTFWLNDNKYRFKPYATMKIDCEECQRTGIIRDKEMDRVKTMCPSCYGVGHHTIRRFDQMDAVCPACGGMGRTDIGGEWDLCERCKGRGIYRLNEWKEIVGLDTMDFNNEKIIKESTDSE